MVCWCLCNDYPVPQRSAVERVAVHSTEVVLLLAGVTVELCRPTPVYLIGITGIVRWLGLTSLVVSYKVGMNCPSTAPLMTAYALFLHSFTRCRCYHSDWSNLMSSTKA